MILASKRVRNHSIVIFLLFLLWVLLWKKNLRLSQPKILLHTSESSLNKLYHQQQQFWNKYFQVLHENFKETDIEPAKWVDYYPREQHLKGKYTNRVLSSKASVTPEIKELFALEHAGMLENLPYDLFEKTYVPNTAGVVTVGGGRFSWLAYLGILALRETGSELPVEILMPTLEDYVKEKDFCNVQLPKLNARCIVLPKVIGHELYALWSEDIKSYQFKILSILASSFQHVILLDSDNIILKDPYKYFTSKLYEKYGMITWPDYWKRTIFPAYYDIAGLKVEETNRVRFGQFELPTNWETDPTDVPYHEMQGTVPDRSTESGQLIVNKATHLKTLLLASYYNLRGPSLYYKLFSLGEAGEGDKDTFETAAFVTKETYYQVKAQVRAVGYFREKGFQGVAMAQRDPLEDYAYYTHLKNDLVANYSASSMEAQLKRIDQDGDIFDMYKSPISTFTIHCNYPKLDPITLMDDESIYDSNKNTLKYNLFGDAKFFDPAQGRDVSFEHKQWSNIWDTLCLQKIPFRHFQKKKNSMNRICAFVNNHLQNLAQPLQTS